MHNSFDKAKLQNPEEFKSDSGISQENFIVIVGLINNKMQEIYNKNPNKDKGVKAKMCIEDKLLLTLFYLHHIPTFKNLGDIFSI